MQEGGGFIKRLEVVTGKGLQTTLTSPGIYCKTNYPAVTLEMVVSGLPYVPQLFLFVHTSFLLLSKLYDEWMLGAKWKIITGTKHKSKNKREHLLKTFTQPFSVA